MFKKIIFIFTWTMFLTFYVEAEQVPFINGYKMSIFDSSNNEEFLEKHVFERVAENHHNKNYSKFYAVMQAHLEEAKKDGHWNKYLEYHQKILYKQRELTEQNKTAARELKMQRDLKLLALCQDNSDLAICKIIRNVMSKNEGLQEATEYLNDILCKNITLDHPFLNEVYEALITLKFYEASIFFKEWMNKNLFDHLIPFGITVTNRLEVLLVLHLEMLDKINKLLENNLKNSTSKHIQYIINYQEAYLSNEYAKKFLLEIAFGIRPPANEIEKNASEILLEYAIKKNKLYKPPE